jgi:hypothetical protein
MFHVHQYDVSLLLGPRVYSSMELGREQSS